MACFNGFAEFASLKEVVHGDNTNQHVFLFCIVI
jgi:hypothetical protein